MNISIQNPDALESRIKKNEVLWKITSKPIIRTSVVLMLLGAAILYFDISTRYTIMKLSTPKAIIYDLHLSFSIGLALLLLGLLLLFFLSLNKRSHFKTLEKIINRHTLNSRSPMVDLIEINNSGVTETTSEYRFEIKWLRFTHYKEYKGFLFLIMNGEISSSIMIDKSYINPTNTRNYKTL